MSFILPLLLCAMAELPALPDVRPIPVTGLWTPEQRYL